MGIKIFANPSAQNVMRIRIVEIRNCDRCERVARSPQASTPADHKTDNIGPVQFGLGCRGSNIGSSINSAAMIVNSNTPNALNSRCRGDVGVSGCLICCDLLRCADSSHCINQLPNCHTLCAARGCFLPGLIRSTSCPQWPGKLNSTVVCTWHADEAAIVTLGKSQPLVASRWALCHPWTTESRNPTRNCNGKSRP